jgi:hypothetical protein
MGILVSFARMGWTLFSMIMRSAIRGADGKQNTEKTLPMPGLLGLDQHLQQVVQVSFDPFAQVCGS